CDGAQADRRHRWSQRWRWGDRRWAAGTHRTKGRRLAARVGYEPLCGVCQWKCPGYVDPSGVGRPVILSAGGIPPEPKDLEDLASNSVNCSMVACGIEVALRFRRPSGSWSAKPQGDFEHVSREVAFSRFPARSFDIAR